MKTAISIPDDLFADAEHVAFSGAVLGLLELALEGGRHVREAVLPDEPAPDRRAGLVQGEQLVLRVAGSGTAAQRDAARPVAGPGDILPARW